MTIVKILAVALGCALAGAGVPALADARLSTSTDPTAAALPLDAQLVALFGQERAALDRAAPRLRAAVRGPKPRPPVIDEAWLAAQSAAPQGDAEFECLAQALYFEARGEPLDGQVAVAEVVLNRVESPRYPATICEVVSEARRKGACQFSYMCDGKPETVGNAEAWDRAAKIARAMIDGAPRRLTGGATHFHAGFVQPRWAASFTRTAEIGGHLFYRSGAVARRN